ncbi:MAG: type II toxin-antitoxin system VapC family toxin [Pyrinomonadaceae bacterium]
MSYLLDTCILSEFKKKRPEQKVISWLDAQLEESLFLSALTIGEIQKGITLLPTSKRRTDLENWLESIIYRYDARILPLNTEVMQRWGELTGKFEQKGRVLPFLDSLIAATALAHGLVLITRNENDFAGTGVTVMNIWK